MRNLNLWRNSFGPFRELNTLSKVMERMLEDVPQATSTSATKYAWNPTCEAKEDERNYYLKFDVPGVPKDAIKLDLHEDRLTVTGERREEKKTEDKEHKIHFSEMYYGSFTRTMAFPIPVDAERTEAKYEDGVLQVTLPKKTSSGVRQITVK